MKKSWSVIFALTLALYVSACQLENEIKVHDYWMRAASQDENTAMYMLIHNHSKESDELISISSDIAEAVEMHKTIIDSNDAMQMLPVSSVSLEPDAEVYFEPGGLHVMFIRLKRELNVGDKVEVTLHFKFRDEIVLNVPVQEEAGEMNH